MTSTEALHRQQRLVNQCNNSLLFHLRSIEEDASVVSELRSFLPDTFPAYGNLRNGAWYVQECINFCYFKSTDGHDRNFQFNSSTRLNLEVALTAARHQGALIVDSTRRGKLFPDSLRATIPIWCCVLNNLLGFEHCAFTAPDWLMTPQQILYISRELIPALISSLPSMTKSLILSELAGKLVKPMVPVWVYPDEDGVLEWKGDFASDTLDNLSEASLDELPFTPLLLLSCSGAKRPRHVSEQSWEYIQGAADDEENWALGLRPDMFWQHKDDILCSDDPNEVVVAVRALVQGHVSAEPPKYVAFVFNASGENTVEVGIEYQYKGFVLLRTSSNLSNAVSESGVLHFYFSTAFAGGNPKLPNSPFSRLLNYCRELHCGSNSGEETTRILVKHDGGEGTTLDDALTLALFLLLAFDDYPPQSKEEIRARAARLQSSLASANTSWYCSQKTIKILHRYFSPLFCPEN